MDSSIDKVDKTTTPPSGETEINSEETLPASEENNGGEAPSKKSAEARIDELIAINKGLENKIDTVLSERSVPPPPAPEKPLEPDVEKAKNYLRGDLGFVTKEDLDNTIKRMEDTQVLNTEHSRLSGMYDGVDGRPRYDRKQVEDYMRNNGVYNPEVAYKSLHETELTDWNLKKADESRKERPYTEKKSTLSANRSDNTITREKLKQVADNPTPANREWYERNRSKILDLMHQGAL